MKTERTPTKLEAPADPSGVDPCGPPAGHGLFTLKLSARVFIASCVALPVFITTYGLSVALNDGTPSLAGFGSGVVAAALVIVGMLVYPLVTAATQRLERPALGASLEVVALITWWGALIGVVIGDNSAVGSMASLLLFVGPAMLLGSYARHRRRTLRLEDRAACGRCTYERPREQDDHNERCPECGNLWWERRSFELFARHRGDRHGVIRHESPAEQRKAGRRFGLVYGVHGAALLLYFAWRFGAVQPVLPTTILLATAKAGSQSSAAAALGRPISRAEADEVLRAVIADRSAPDDLDHDLRMTLEAAIPAGLFSDAAVDEFFSESVSFELLPGKPRPDGTLPFVLKADILGATIDLQPYLASAGVRINEGPWEQPHRTPMTIKDVVHEYTDYSILWPHDPSPATHESEAWNDKFHFHPAMLPPDLPLGEHTVTVRLALVSATGRSGQQAVWSFSYFTPGGDPIGNPAALWQETRDITATFRVP